MGNTVRALPRARLRLAVSIVLAGSTPAAAYTPASLAAEHAAGEIVVKLKSRDFRSQSASVTALVRALGPGAVLQAAPFLTDGQMQKLRLADTTDPKLSRALAALAAEPEVEYAEPNYIYHAYTLPNDPDFGKIWGLDNQGQADSAGQLGSLGADIHIAELWDKGFTGSRNVVVAVIDTGMDWTHPDLAANLYANPGESGGEKETNGKDDDGNGFVDDVHGWNFVANSGNTNDDYKHGTHVSGTIGAAGNNGVGVAGVNWQVSLMPVKFLDATGSGSLENAVNAINYARMMRVNIMSNSWGGGAFTQALLDAITAAKNQGILFVAAAGNNGTDNDTTPSYPASYAVDNIVSVAATDNKDQLAGFSNYGMNTVHVAAPGVNVYSTFPGGAYDVLSGTSMATPHVSGIAALLLAANPTWNYSEIKSRLIETSDPVPMLRHKVVAKGRVNAYNAFYDIVPPNDDPPDSSWRDVAADIETAHPYVNNLLQDYPVKQPGAQYVRVHFAQVGLENMYDTIEVIDPSGLVVDQLTGAATDVYSEYVKADSLTIRFKSDGSVTDFGFKIDKIQVIP